MTVATEFARTRPHAQIAVAVEDSNEYVHTVMDGGPFAAQGISRITTGATSRTIYMQNGARIHIIGHKEDRSPLLGLELDAAFIGDEQLVLGGEVPRGIASFLVSRLRTFRAQVADAGLHVQTL